MPQCQENLFNFLPNLTSKSVKQFLPLNPFYIQIGKIETFQSLHWIALHQALIFIVSVQFFKKNN
jgi:hypothetical protein